MKKQFKLMALASAAMLFAACSQEDLLSPQEQLAQSPENNAIQFGTYISKTGTRSGYQGVITDTELQDGKSGTKTTGFGVFAYHTEGNDWAGSSNAVVPNFMYNQQVYYNTGWKYEPLKYWPNEFSTGNVDENQPSTEDDNAKGLHNYGKVSFFAYAPYVPVTVGSGAPADASEGITALTSNTTTGEPKVTYKFNKNSDADNTTFNMNLANNVDLLWGLNGKNGTGYNITDGSTTNQAKTSEYNTNLTKQDVDEKVSFNFKHALAKIGGVNGIKVVLDVDDNTETNTLDSKSNVSIQSINIKNVAAKVATGGVFNIATGAWESPTMDGNVTLGSALNITIDNTTPGVSADIFTAVGTPFTNNGSAWNHTGVPSTNPSSIFTSTGPGEFLLIPGIADQQLEVTITYQVRTYDTNLSGNYSTVNQTIKNIVTLPTLAVNKYYTLILHLGLTSVKFEASVTGWDTPTTSEDEHIWLPSNVVTP